jgi:polynucleotide 5'-hydroxyl-kinase GRC3/NOL9
LTKIVISIEKGEGLRLYGPLVLKVLKGSVSILGAELKPNDEVEVRAYRSYSILSLESSEIEIKVGEGGRIEFPVREDHYLKWLELADTLLDSIDRPSIIAVVGPVESGKTSYAALLANRAISRGLAPAILDADIGQADIGPPGFISLSYPEGWITWLRELNPVAMKFVGSIEPSHVVGRMISGINSLIRRALKDGLGLIVIDTDGWVQGLQAIEAKIDILDSIGIDALIVMGDRLLYESLRRSLSAPTYLLPSPTVKITRNPSDRKTLRKENYRRFIGNNKREIDLRKVAIKGSCLLNGSPVEDDSIKRYVKEVLDNKVLAISELPGTLCIALESTEPPEAQQVKVLQKRLNKDIIVIYSGGFRGVLSSLRDPEGYDHPAILSDLDFSEKKAIFITSYTGEVREVIFSRIRLTNEFDEIRGRIWI